MPGRPSRSAGFQPAVSPISNRQSFKTKQSFPTAGAALRLEALRYSRLETFAEGTSRREFFHAAGRFAVLGAMAIAAWVLGRRGQFKVQVCVNEGVCTGCWAFDQCRLPQRTDPSPQPSPLGRGRSKVCGFELAKRNGCFPSKPPTTAEGTGGNV
jgi:hypothetical protein